MAYHGFLGSCGVRYPGQIETESDRVVDPICEVEQISTSRIGTTNLHYPESGNAQ